MKKKLVVAAVAGLVAWVGIALNASGAAVITRKLPTSMFPKNVGTKAPIAKKVSLSNAGLSAGFTPFTSTDVLSEGMPTHQWISLNFYQNARSVFTDGDNLLVTTSVDGDIYGNYFIYNRSTQHWDECNNGLRRNGENKIITNGIGIFEIDGDLYTSSFGGYYRLRGADCATGTWENILEGGYNYGAVPVGNTFFTFSFNYNQNQQTVSRYLPSENRWEDISTGLLADEIEPRKIRQQIATGYPHEVFISQSGGISRFVDGPSPHWEQIPTGADFTGAAKLTAFGNAIYASGIVGDDPNVPSQYTITRWIPGSDRFTPMTEEQILSWQNVIDGSCTPFHDTCYRSHQNSNWESDNSFERFNSETLLWEAVATAVPIESLPPNYLVATQNGTFIAVYWNRGDTSNIWLYIAPEGL